MYFFVSKCHISSLYSSDFCRKREKRTCTLAENLFFISILVSLYFYIFFFLFWRNNCSIVKKWINKRIFFFYRNISTRLYFYGNYHENQNFQTSIFFMMTFILAFNFLISLSYEIFQHVIIPDIYYEFLKKNFFFSSTR